MSVCPSELLDWAKQSFAGRENCEVTCRASISRSYYSSLHEAIETFDIYIDKRNPSSHKAVIDELVLRSNVPGQGRLEAGKLAKMLPKIKRLRVKADYDLNESITPQEVQRALETADDIFQSCSEVTRLRNQTSASA